MACNSATGGCNSGGCYNHGDGLDHSSETPQQPLLHHRNDTNLCIKCKSNPPIITTTHSSAAEFCGDCFRGNLYGKFRLAVTSHALITPSDHVLLAFSGGPSSRVALQFVHEMQNRAQKNFDASRDRSLPVFGVGVVFIDESAAHQVPRDKVDEAIQEMRSLVSNLSPPRKQLHVVPIENIYTSDSNDGRDRLTKLLDAVTDATGKQDLLQHLRMLTLQKIASENGCNKIILGSCISRIACHVITETVKGKGYSLPADVQHVDARWEIPVVLPLRDCTYQELNMLCCLDGLKTVQCIDSPPSGINSLVSSFVTLLQEENPSRECTIVRTAGKLTPYSFNRIPEINDSNVPLATRRRQKRYNMKPKETISSELFCAICNSPLDESDLLNSSSPKDCENSIFGTTCCSSCRFQILPKERSSIEYFCTLLPEPLVARANNGSHGSLSLLREKIQDCLLSDDEEGT